MSQIRKDQSASPSQHLRTSDENLSELLKQIETQLVIAERARAELPPLTTSRSGLSARMELWLKRLFRRATHWYTWEQINFNSATQTMLMQIHVALAQLRLQQEEQLKEFDDAIEAQKQFAHAQVVSAEKRLREFIALSQQDAATQLENKFAALLEEQRVWLKQLALESNETAVVSDRARRNFQLQIDALERQLEEVRKILPNELMESATRRS